MRTLLRCAAFAVLTAALLGCDSEQPTQGGSVQAVLTLSTAPAAVRKADVWEIWEDITFPRDGVPDRPKRTSQPSGPIIHRCDPLDESSIVTYPWGFSVEVSVLRKGSTTPEILSTTSLQTSRFTGVTLLPTTDVPVPIPDGDNDPTGPGDNVYATEYYRFGNKLSTANADYALRCERLTIVPNIGPGDSAPELMPNPATIALNPGDTLIVQARKADAATNPILGGVFPIPSLVGGLTVGGRPVSPSGTSQSTEEDGSGVSFSYTLN